MAAYLKSEVYLDRIIECYEDDNINQLFRGELKVIKDDLQTLRVLKEVLTSRVMDIGTGELLTLSGGVVKQSAEGKLIEAFLNNKTEK